MQYAICCTQLSSSLTGSFSLASFLSCFGGLALFIVAVGCRAADVAVRCRIFPHSRRQFSTLMSIIRSSCLIIVPWLQIYTDLCPVLVWQASQSTVAAAGGVVSDGRPASDVGVAVRSVCRQLHRRLSPSIRALAVRLETIP